MQNVYIPFSEYEKKARWLHEKIVKARYNQDWVSLQKYMKEAEELKQRFAQQRFSIEEATPDKEDQTNLLHSVVKLTVLADIMGGAMLEMEGRMKKAGIKHSDAYDTCHAIQYNVNHLIKAMDDLGESTALALETLTDQVESKYVFGMDNYINQLLNQAVEVRVA